MSRITPPRASHEAMPSQKRKRAAHDAAAPVPRKSIKSVVDKAHQVDHDAAAVSKMSAAMLSDHLAQQLRRHAGDRSAIELDDQFIPASAIRDTSSFKEPRVSKHLLPFLRSVSDGDEQRLATCDEVASPHTIVITASGIRAAHLARELRPLASNDYKIGKLFAKHLKLTDTIDFVQKHKVIIGVGTPVRVKELIDHDALKAAAIQRIIIDGSYVDEKKRTIFDLKEIYIPMLELLNSAKIKSRMGTTPDGLEVIVF